MRVKRRLKIRWLSLFFLLVLPVVAYGGMPEVSHVMVTDVTTTSFSVIWAASEASTADLEVYEDENGAVPIADAVIEPHPIECGNEQIRIMAEDQGVMKVRATGFAANSTYYFRTVTTSKSTGDITYHPDGAPLMSVTTQSLTVRTFTEGDNIVPFSNDNIIEECYLDDGITHAEGTLLLATVAGGSHPITAFVGDGAELPNALIDLNNVFGRGTFENLDLSQGLNLTLLNFRGLAGNSIVTHVVPVDESLSEVKPAEFAMKAGWNMVSFQLEPGVTDTETVLAPIMDKVSAIWAYDTSADYWFRYDKNSPFPWLNDLEDMHCFVGYWLLMDDDASLPVNGTFAPGPVHLHVGWNLVGHRSIETVDLMDAVGLILDKLNSIWTYDTTEDKWLRYDKISPFPWLNDLQQIEPGKAYWVHVTEECDW